MSETATTEQATAQTQTSAATTTEKPAEQTATTETAKPTATTETKPAEAAKPAEAEKPKSPVSTGKSTSIIGDAGKPQTNADGKQPDGAKAGEAEAKKEGEEKKEGAKAPEKYDLKAPEGMTLDQAMLEKFTPLAKKYDLSNEAVQDLVNFQAEHLKSVQGSFEQQQADNFDKFVEQTVKDTQDFFGSKLEGILPYVAKGRDQFADKEVMDLLDATGLSNHKAFIRMFDKMGRTVSEDKLVDGKPDQPGDTRTDGQIVYAKDKK